MADNYATIQQHQPLRTPAGWDRQEKALIVQLDEIFDDLYRRFGRLRLADMGKAFQKQIADDEGNIAQLTLDVSGLAIEVGNKISKTTAYQTADSIVTAAVSQAATSASQTYIAKTSTYQDAASIVTAAEGYTDGLLISYSTTSQMNDAINLSVAGIAPAFSTSVAYAVGDIVSYNGKIYRFTTAHSAGAWNSSQVTQTSLSSDAYLVQSGIAIDANGVDITGSKYVKIRSGGTFYVDATDFQIDSANKLFKTGNWTLGENGIFWKNGDLEFNVVKRTNGIHFTFHDTRLGDSHWFYMTENGDLIPDNNQTAVIKTYANIGSSGNKWNIGYFNSLFGDLTGDVTGNCSGSSGSCTGNAATATKLSRAPTYGELSGR